MSPVDPFPGQIYDAVREQLRPKHRDVYDLLLLTAARPGELLGLRMKDVERTGDVWRAEIVRHKTGSSGKCVLKLT